MKSDPLGLIRLRKRALSSLAERFVEHARTIVLPGVALES
jgi:hypothetical protein